MKALSLLQPWATLYLCPGCWRWVPWCFGAADDFPELCDDCWSVASGVAP